MPSLCDQLPGGSFRKRLVHALPGALLALAATMAWSGIPARTQAPSRRLVFAATEFPPYYAEDLPNFGPVSEIVAAAFEHAGYTVEFRFYPWARALNLGQAGAVDGLSGIWFSKDREPFFLFSKPLLGNRIVLLKLKGGGPERFAALESLRPFRIGTVRGYSNPPGFDKAGLKVEEVTEDLQNLRKLLARRLDLVLIDRGVGQHLIRQHLPQARDAFEELAPPLDSRNLHLAISRQSDRANEILEDFNKGLDWLARQGRLKRILARHGM